MTRREARGHCVSRGLTTLELGQASCDKEGRLRRASASSAGASWVDSRHDARQVLSGSQHSLLGNYLLDKARAGLAMPRHAVSIGVGQSGVLLGVPRCRTGSCIVGLPGTVDGVTEGWPEWLNSEMTVFQGIGLARVLCSLTYSDYHNWEPYRTIFGAVRSLFPVQIRYGSTKERGDEPEDLKTLWLRPGKREDLEFDWKNSYRVVEAPEGYEVELPEDQNTARVWSDGRVRGVDGRNWRRCATVEEHGHGVQFLPGRKPRLRPVVNQVRVERHRGFLMPDGPRKKARR